MWTCDQINSEHVFRRLTFLLSPSTDSHPLLKDIDRPPSASGDVSSSNVSDIIGISKT